MAEPAERTRDEEVRFRWRLAALVVLGLAVRLIVIGVVGPEETVGLGDAGYYHLQANAIADGEWYPKPEVSIISDLFRPDAQHPPLFPGVLAVGSFLGLDSMGDHQVVCALIGAAGVLLIGLLGRRVGGDRVALLAALLATLWPALWISDIIMMSESLTVPIAAAVGLAAYGFIDRPDWRRAAVLGALCSAAVLSRTELILLFPLLVFPLVLQVAATPRQMAGLLGAAAAAAVVVSGPWVIPNMVRFEEPITFTAQGGITLTVASCDSTWYGDKLGYSDLECVPPLADVAVPPERREQFRRSRQLVVAHIVETRDRLLAGERTIPIPLEKCQAIFPDQPGLTEEQCNELVVRDLDLVGDSGEVDAVYVDIGQEYVREHLSRYPVVVAARVGRTLGIYRPVQQIELEAGLDNRPEWANWWAFAMWYPLAGLAVYGTVLLRRRRVPLLPLLVFPVITLLSVAVALGSTRFRIATDVVLVVLAAVAIITLYDRWRARAAAV